MTTALIVAHIAAKAACIVMVVTHASLIVSMAAAIH